MIITVLQLQWAMNVCLLPGHRQHRCQSQHMVSVEAGSLHGAASTRPALQGLHDMWKGPSADLHAAREGVAGLDDGHAVRPLSKALQRQLLRPGLLQVGHHPQVEPACSAAHVLQAS